MKKYLSLFSVLFALSFMVANPVFAIKYAEAERPSTAYDYDDCDGNNDGTDARDTNIDCSYSECIVDIFLCGVMDNKAKYRVHFDTEEPFFDGDEDCLTTSDKTAMYRPKSTALNDGKFTGPKALGTRMVDDFLGWVFSLEELGVAPGDYLAIWVDVHKKGIQDRVPDTDSSDGCAKPQNESEVLQIIVEPCPCFDDIADDTPYSSYAISSALPCTAGSQSDTQFGGVHHFLFGTDYDVAVSIAGFCDGTFEYSCEGGPAGTFTLSQWQYEQCDAGPGWPPTNPD
jgi:hypothetical protein